MATNWPLAKKKNNLHARAEIIQTIRHFFITGGYLEVDTPLRIPAPAPEAFIDAIAAPPWFLQTSPELCMKRMLAAGFGRLFQICHCWRQEERGVRHLPEFTMLEWYRSNSDYHDLMDECEALFHALAASFEKDNGLQYRGQAISLARPWQRLTVREAFARYCGISMEKALEENLFDELMARNIEPRLGVIAPVFLMDYPAERGALARLKEDDPSVAERFELYIGGLELANAFSELTDPVEQRRRFLEESAARKASGKTVYPQPENFLAELAALPPSAGIALGVDRLVMILLDAASIDEVVPFTPEEL